MLCAYARLVTVQLRIKFKQSDWLKQKITFVTKKALAVPAYETQFLQMHESVRLAARLFPGQPACLPKSIVLSDMLVVRGYSAKIMLGVSRHGDQLSSHAWVEVNDLMIAEPESVSNDFAPLYGNSASHDT